MPLNVFANPDHRTLEEILATRRHGSSEGRKGGTTIFSSSTPAMLAQNLLFKHKSTKVTT